MLQLKQTQQIVTMLADLWQAFASPCQNSWSRHAPPSHWGFVPWCHHCCGEAKVPQLLWQWSKVSFPGSSWTLGEVTPTYTFQRSFRASVATSSKDSLLPSACMHKLCHVFLLQVSVLLLGHKGQNSHILTLERDFSLFIGSSFTL